MILPYPYVSVAIHTERTSHVRGFLCASRWFQALVCADKPRVRRACLGQRVRSKQGEDPPCSSKCHGISRSSACFQLGVQRMDASDCFWSPPERQSPSPHSVLCAEGSCLERLSSQSQRASCASSPRSSSSSKGGRESSAVSAARSQPINTSSLRPMSVFSREPAKTSAPGPDACTSTSAPVCPHVDQPMCARDEMITPSALRQPCFPSCA
mmetsp:Transcript_53631/g.123323  ORF Transcript_53631/g.123323 Transcript_53631/m.123323 type:complete len:211 (+) Transcript_53631:74-706(+)